MTKIRLVGATLMGFIIASSSGLVAQAIQTNDGTVHFSQPPRLLKATTPHIGAGYRGADYYFTFQVPETADEPLKQLAFAQNDGVEQISFRLGATRAYRNQRRKQVAALSSVTRQRQQVVVNFEEPIQPGETVTVGLKAQKNPKLGGVYLFGVTAFPEGEKVSGQFLGYGRLHFFKSGGGGRS